MPDTLTLVSAKDTSVVVPIGTDLRKAASVRTPFQTLANWLLYLDDRLAAVLSGAQTFSTLNGATVTCNTVNAGTVNSVDAVFTGLFKPNGGQIDLGNEITQGSATIPRNKYTKVNSSGSSAFTLTIDGTGPPINGEWVQVYYIGTGTCTIKDPDGTTTVGALNGSTSIVIRLQRMSGSWRAVG